MQAKRTCFALLFPLTLFFCAHGSAQKIESMKLLTPNVGWVSTADNLFWTTDAGQHWRNITPKLSPAQNIDSVFFLDTSHGWALLISETADEAEPQLDLASTADGGGGWSITRVNIPHLSPESVTLTGGAISILSTLPMAG